MSLNSDIKFKIEILLETMEEAFNHIDIQMNELRVEEVLILLEDIKKAKISIDDVFELNLIEVNLWEIDLNMFVNLYELKKYEEFNKEKDKIRKNFFVWKEYISNLISSINVS